MNRQKELRNRRGSRDLIRAHDKCTIDLTPRWGTLLPILLSAIEHGTEQGRSNAGRSLRKLAWEADSSRQLQLRAREAIRRLVAMWPEISRVQTVEEQEALAEASAVLALVERNLMVVRDE